MECQEKYLKFMKNSDILSKNREEVIFLNEQSDVYKRQVLGALCMILSAALYRVVKKDKKTA